MKRRIHIDLLLNSEAAADKVLTLILDKIAILDTFDVLTSGKIYGMLNLLQGSSTQTRFNNPLDADILRDFVVGLWTTGALASKILARSRIALHTCSHDEINIQPCIEDNVLVK